VNSDSLGPYPCGNGALCHGRDDVTEAVTDLEKTVTDLETTVTNKTVTFNTVVEDNCNGHAPLNVFNKENESLAVPTRYKRGKWDVISPVIPKSRI